MKRRYWVTALAAMLVGAFLFPTAASAGPDKVDLCHATGDDGYVLISVSEKAVAKHVENHGDGLVGDPVPGMEGYVFGEGCVAELAGPAPGCYDATPDSFADLLYSGPVDTANNIQFAATADGSCGSPQDVPSLALVIADDLAEAQTKCGVLNGFETLGGVDVNSAGWTGLPSNAWLCLLPS